MSPLLVSDHRGDAAEDAGVGRPRLPEHVSTCLDVSISLQPPWPGQLNMKCLQDVDRSATAEGASVSVTIIWTIHHENRETNIHPAGDRCTTAALHYNITVTMFWCPQCLWGISIIIPAVSSPAIWTILTLSRDCGTGVAGCGDRSTSRWWYEEHLLMLLMLIMRSFR